MAIIDTLKVYESLKVEMPDRSAKAVAKALEQSFEEYRVTQSEFLVTKQEMTEFRAEVRNDLASMRQGMAELRVVIDVKIAGAKTELVRWMFVFWVGQIGVLTALLIALR